MSSSSFSVKPVGPRDFELPLRSDTGSGAVWTWRDLEADRRRRSPVDSSIEADQRVNREADTETDRGQRDQRTVAVPAFGVHDDSHGNAERHARGETDDAAQYEAVAPATHTFEVGIGNRHRAAGGLDREDVGARREEPAFDWFLTTQVDGETIAGTGLAFQCVPRILRCSSGACEERDCQGCRQMPCHDPSP